MAQVDQNSKKSISLSVKLNSRRSIIFNGYDGPLTFENRSKTDSLITKTIFTDKPVHIFYSSIIVTTNGGKRENGTLLLFPGDSVVLGNNGKTVEYSTGFHNFIDSFISVFDGSYLFDGIPPGKLLDSIGLRGLLAQANSMYVTNEKRISQLSLQPAQKQCLKEFNYQTEARQICAIPFLKVSAGERPLLDSIYNVILLQADKIALINSPFSSIIYYNLITYSALKKGANTDQFWSCIDKADIDIKTSFFYKPYIIQSIKNTYKNVPDEINEMVKGLRAIPPSSVFTDTLSDLADILSKTRTNYKIAKEELDQYAGGKYSFILDENDILHRQQRNIKSLAEVGLFDFSKRKMTLQKVLANGKSDIVVLDFWASWCVPCVADYPFLKKTEDALKGSSIRFISVSIDTEEDTEKWISRSKQLKTYNRPDQYRLQNPKQSPVNSFFNLYSIPRYIVIDKKGVILEEVFDRPKEGSFERKLRVYLTAYNK